MEIKLVQYVGHWLIGEPICHPDWLFIFGENDKKEGSDKQTKLREYKNAIGIPIKKNSKNNYKSFYDDKDYKDNCKKIDNAITNIMTLMKSGKYIALAIPKGGIGTQMIKCPQYAPKTYKYLKESIEKLKSLCI